LSPVNITPLISAPVILLRCLEGYMKALRTDIATSLILFVVTANVQQEHR